MTEEQTPKHKPDDDKRRDGESMVHVGGAIEANPDDYPEAKAEQNAKAEKQPYDPFSDRWKTLGEWGEDWFSEAPPRREWLLERPNDEHSELEPMGVLPLGKVGMLVAAGGIGKTMALAQLALAVATGERWLGHYYTPNTGRVLLALGEEDEEEVRRRMYNAAGAMGLLKEEHADKLKLALSRIVALPLAGTPVALTEGDGRGGPSQETEALGALRRRLEDGSAEGWRLIILDPLSRFAGCDAEKDNAAATRFVEAAESLTKAPGKPTVLMAHHTNKTSRTAELGANASAASARGATGLTDGVRWVASLDEVRDTDRPMATFEGVKSNYAIRAPKVFLVRDGEHGGALRVENDSERNARMQAMEEAKEAKGSGNGAKKGGRRKSESEPIPEVDA